MHFVYKVVEVDGRPIVHVDGKHPNPPLWITRLRHTHVFLIEDDPVAPRLLQDVVDQMFLFGRLTHWREPHFISHEIVEGPRIKKNRKVLQNHKEETSQEDPNQKPFRCNSEHSFLPSKPDQVRRLREKRMDIIDESG